MSARLPRITLRIVGAVTIGLALVGLLYNGAGIAAISSGAFDQTVATDASQRYLFVAFYVLSGLCITAYIVLFVCGVQFCRLAVWWLWPFLAALGLEAILYFFTGRLWNHPTYGMSIAGATGISEGGLVPQFYSLFPLWALLIVRLSAR